MFVMLELEQALERILAAVPPAQPEEIPVSDAHRRVAVQAIDSPMDLPAFDNSAMDGYAVRSADVGRATKEAPARLRIIGKVAAGDLFHGELAAGSCVRLFTGSPLPNGADCVVMQEDTQSDTEDAGEVTITEPSRPWENVRLKGEDVRLGQQLMTAGQPIGVGHLCLLSAVGISRVLVGRQATVGLIATGSELREPGTPLTSGQIYESNRAGLAALIRSAGAIPITFPLVEDKPEPTRQALSAAIAQCDIVVSAGGASVGELDLIKPTLSDLGGEIGFWKVAMRPGRPFVFGQLQGKLFFGLPGNPVSALVTYLLLVRPALRRWQGAADTELRRVSGVLAQELRNPGSRRHFVRVRIHIDGAVSIAGPQGSHMLRSFAEAQGLVDVPAETSLPAGASVTVRLWEQ